MICMLLWLNHRQERIETNLIKWCLDLDFYRPVWGRLIKNQFVGKDVLKTYCQKSSFRAVVAVLKIYGVETQSHFSALSSIWYTYFEENWILINPK